MNGRPLPLARLYLELAVLLLLAAQPLEAHLAGLRNRPDDRGRSIASVSGGGGRPAAEAVFTSCLGGLRAVIADMIWMRAIRMEEEHKYYELVALLEGMLEMQPHVVSVWAFQAHVLAVDLGSIAHEPDPDEAFRWIQRGIGVLEKGIERNPDSSLLEYELAMIYMLKLSPDAVKTERWRDMVRRLAPEKAALGDFYEGLRQERVHFKRAAEKSDASRWRRLLCERSAIRCLERMGDFAGAEREWLALRERSAALGDTGGSIETFFREFMRQLVCVRLLGDDAGASRGAYERMKGFFPGTVPEYREMIAQQIRAYHHDRAEARARALYEALRRADPAETRSYEEIVK